MFNTFVVLQDLINYFFFIFILNLIFTQKRVDKTKKSLKAAPLCYRQ